MSKQPDFKFRESEAKRRADQQAEADRLRQEAFAAWQRAHPDLDERVNDILGKYMRALGYSEPAPEDITLPSLPREGYTVSSALPDLSALGPNTKFWAAGELVRLWLIYGPAPYRNRPKEGEVIFRLYFNNGANIPIHYNRSVNKDQMTALGKALHKEFGLPVEISWGWQPMGGGEPAPAGVSDMGPTYYRPNLDVKLIISNDGIRNLRAESIRFYLLLGLLFVGIVIYLVMSM